MKNNVPDQTITSTFPIPSPLQQPEIDADKVAIKKPHIEATD